MEKFIGRLTQALSVAVTAMFPRNAEPVTFAGAEYVAIFPAVGPGLGSPIKGLSFVQVYVSPTVLLLNAPGATEEPGQTAILAMALITGVGLILMVKVIGALVHPLRVAVTEIVEVITDPVLFAGAE